MTPEELATMSMKTAVAEMRYSYDNPGSVVLRYGKLRLAVYRAFLDGCDDPEFAAFLKKGHGLFTEAAAQQVRMTQAVDLMAEPEMTAAMKRLQEQIEQQG